jgi:hypothetical protein
MAAKPTKIVVNCATGESQTIELTDAEIAQREADAAAYALQKAAEDEAAEEKAALKESAKAKLVAGTPLTAEEAAVLVI